ncbi:hypothetical protein TNCV_2874431 [Trichonephila clavipes]|nr:hypothetical protein TNCV_2874431 [Trichonephila clavipes]
MACVQAYVSEREKREVAVCDIRRSCSIEEQKHILYIPEEQSSSKQTCHSSPNKTILHLMKKYYLTSYFNSRTSLEKLQVNAAMVMTKTEEEVTLRQLEKKVDFYAEI